MGAIPPVLVITGLCMMLVFIGVFWALGEIKRREAMATRLDAVLEGHRPATVRNGGSGQLLSRILGSQWIRALSGVFGIRIDRIGEYKPNWFIVLLGSFVAARIGGGIATDILGEFVLIPATLALWIMAARMTFASMHRARLDKLFKQFPDALGLITRGVRVGIPVVEAVRNVSLEAPHPTAPEFKALADRLTMGVPLDEALAETAARTGLREYSFFSTALALQARTGGGLAETLDNLADVIRKRVALRERGYALAAEARTSAAILVAIPILTTILLFIISPQYVLLLFNTDNGRMVLGIALAMLATGIASMRYLIRKALS